MLSKVKHPDLNHFKAALDVSVTGDAEIPFINNKTEIAFDGRIGKFLLDKMKAAISGAIRSEGKNVTEETDAVSNHFLDCSVARTKIANTTVSIAYTGIGDFSMKRVASGEQQISGICSYAERPTQATIFKLMSSVAAVAALGNMVKLPQVCVFGKKFSEDAKNAATAMARMDVKVSNILV